MKKLMALVLCVAMLASCIVPMAAFADGESAPAATRIMTYDFTNNSGNNKWNTANDDYYSTYSGGMIFTYGQQTSNQFMQIQSVSDVNNEGVRWHRTDANFGKAPGDYSLTKTVTAGKGATTAELGSYLYKQWWQIFYNSSYGGNLVTPGNYMHMSFNISFDNLSPTDGFYYAPTYVYVNNNRSTVKEIDAAYVVSGSTLKVFNNTVEGVTLETNKWYKLDYVIKSGAANDSSDGLDIWVYLNNKLVKTITNYQHGNLSSGGYAAYGLSVRHMSHGRVSGKYYYQDMGDGSGLSTSKSDNEIKFDDSSFAEYTTAPVIPEIALITDDEIISSSGSATELYALESDTAADFKSKVAFMAGGNNVTYTLRDANGNELADNAYMTGTNYIEINCAAVDNSISNVYATVKGYDYLVSNGLILKESDFSAESQVMTLGDNLTTESAQRLGGMFGKANDDYFYASVAEDFVGATNRTGARINFGVSGSTGSYVTNLDKAKWNTATARDTVTMEFNFAYTGDADSVWFYGNSNYITAESAQGTSDSARDAASASKTWLSFNRNGETYADNALVENTYTGYDRWHRVAFTVYPATKTYSMYLNGVKVVNNGYIGTSTYDTDSAYFWRGMRWFGVKANYSATEDAPENGILAVDDFKIYKGDYYADSRSNVELNIPASHTVSGGDIVLKNQVGFADFAPVTSSSDNLTFYKDLTYTDSKTSGWISDGNVYVTVSPDGNQYKYCRVRHAVGEWALSADGTNYSVTVPVTNHNADEATFTVYIAQYSVDGMKTLEAVDCDLATLASGESDVIEVTLPADADATDAIVYVWDSSLYPHRSQSFN